MNKMDMICRVVVEANSLIGKGEYDAAENAIRSCPYYQELTDDSAPLYVTEMNSLLSRGDLKTALNVARRLDLPNLSAVVNIDRLSYLAQIYQAMGNLDEALEVIERAKTIAHQNESEIDSDVLCMIAAQYGYILADLKRWSDALLALHEAKQLCAGNDQKESIHLYLAYCLQAEHRFAEALQELESILPTDRTKKSGMISEIQFRKGAILLQMKRYGEAYRAFLEAEGNGTAKLETAIQQGKAQAAAKLLAN